MSTEYDEEIIDVAYARRIAAQWHSPNWRDWNITALSHGRDDVLSADGLASEVRREYQRVPAEDLRLLLAFAEAWTATPITSVWSSHGHTFITEDEHQSCLSCGAVFDLSHDDPADASHGRYHAANGDDPIKCMGRDTFHGDPRETGHLLDCENGCDRCEHGCNCLLCA